MEKKQRYKTVNLLPETWQHITGIKFSEGFNNIDAVIRRLINVYSKTSKIAPSHQESA